MSAASLVEALVALLLVTGGALSLIGSIGLVRMRNFFERLHGPGKASTLGMLCILVATAIHFSLASGSTSMRELLVSAFIAVTAPVSAYVLGRAALHRRMPGSPRDAD
jgi:multicomponent K+:H+ antiporter subunit G